jgi:ribosome-binding factor A
MDSTRQLKFARLIQKEISNLFSREGKNYYGSSFVTVTNVKITPDLSVARIHVSVFQHKGAEVLKQLSHHSREIRKALGERIRNQARIIPELEFFIDDSLDYADRINEIMKDIHIPPEK